MVRNDEKPKNDNSCMIEDWSETLRAAQLQTTYSIGGTEIPRIRFGDEQEDWGAESQPCFDCGAVKGQFHVVGCDGERCPKCNRQVLTCGCLETDANGNCEETNEGETQMATEKENRTFTLGRIGATSNAFETLHREDVAICLGRHARCDWGDCCPEDAQENEFALGKYLRLFSVYHDRKGVKFWIITEADRSLTTVLLPEDY